jgi:hypothetical protein
MKMKMPSLDGKHRIRSVIRSTGGGQVISIWHGSHRLKLHSLYGPEDYEEYQKDYGETHGEG